MTHITTNDFHIEEETAVTFGNFDGLHLGHRKLVETVKANAGAALSPVVFSFFPHPLTVLRGGPNVRMIVSPEEKMFLLEEMGVDYFIEYPFTKDFAGMGAESFMRDILVGRLNCRLLVVGEGFSFGSNRTGNGETIGALGEKYGVKVIIVPPVTDNGVMIRSTIIRDLISSAEFSQAEKYLGRPYFVAGRVREGKQVGRTIGFPTVNLIPFENKLLPPDGVYITKTRIRRGLYSSVVNSVTNIGFSPTVQGKRKTIETFLLGFNGSLYGEIVWVDFYERLRNEIEFGSVEALREQINKDVGAAIRYFE